MHVLAAHPGDDKCSCKLCLLFVFYLFLYVCVGALVSRVATRWVTEMMFCSLSFSRGVLFCRWSGNFFYVFPLACARGLCCGFSKLLYEVGRSDFVTSRFLFHLSGLRVPIFTYFRCLWPDWLYSRLSCLVLGVQATDQKSTGLLSFGILLSKGSG